MGWPRRVGVVGAGYMGRGMAEVFAIAGTPSVLADVSRERAEAALGQLMDEVERHERDLLVPTESAARVGRLVSAATDLEAAVAGADLIVEAVFEDRQTKLETLRRIEAAAEPSAVIATNTSAIAIRDLSAVLARPERFVGAHWFNPPQFVPGVELIAAPSTEPDVLDRVERFLSAVGKRPCRVGDSPGFVGNRLQYALFQEAAAVVEEGLASAETVDEVVRGTFGFRLPFFGPFAIADMAGLDVYRGAYRVLAEGFPGHFVPPRVLADRIERGELGAKTGRGFVIRDPAQAASLVARRDRQYVQLAGILAHEDPDTGRDTGGHDGSPGQGRTHMIKRVARPDATVHPLPGRDWHTYIGPDNVATERVSMGVSVYPAGSRPPGHVHDTQEETIYCAAGHGRIVTPDEVAEVEPGVTVWVAPGTQHATESDGPEPLELVCFFAPPVVPGSYEKKPVELVGAAAGEPAQG